ncbi:MAG: efflux RND transporter periplasmic adaptor subunit [Candidatus Levyibacteriota bacterium]
MKGFADKILFFLKKPLVIAAIIILVIIGIVWRNITVAKNGVQYQTAQVTKGTLISTVTAAGQVTVSNRVSVTTQANGTVSQVFVTSGDTVQAGQKIAELTLDSVGQQKSNAAYASYLSAQNSLNSAKANLNSLQSTLFKANQTFINDKGIPNPSDGDKSDPKYIEENADWLAAEANYEDQQGVINQTQASLSNAWLAYQAVSSTIVAPQSGKLIDLTITPGMQISQNVSSTNTTTGVAVASIKTEGTPVVSVSIAEVDGPKVQVGQKVTVTFDALPNNTYTGKIVGVNTTGSVSSGVTTYPATILLDNSANEILPNMSATANIITKIKDNVLLVPTSAVQSTGTASTVRVLQNGSVNTVTVGIGDSSDTQTEITSGLTQGQEVITGTITTGTTTQSTGSSPFGGGLRLGGFGGGGGGGGGGRGAAAGR